MTGKAHKTMGKIRQGAVFNNIAMRSYFQSKPSPSEAEKAFFVKCVGVPVDEVEAFLRERSNVLNEKWSLSRNIIKTEDLGQSTARRTNQNVKENPKPLLMKSTFQALNGNNSHAPQYDFEFDQDVFKSFHHTEVVTQETPVSLVDPDLRAPLFPNDLGMLYGNMTFPSSHTNYKSAGQRFAQEDLESAASVGNSEPYLAMQMPSTPCDPLPFSSVNSDDWMTNDEIMFGEDNEEDGEDDETLSEKQNTNSLLSKDGEFNDSGYTTNESIMNVSNEDFQIRDGQQIAITSKNAIIQSKEDGLCKVYRDKEKLTGLAQLFLLEQGGDGKPAPVTTLTVLQVRQGFKKNVLEAELTDGDESSKNFLFKIVPGNDELELGSIIKLTSYRHIGARICVDSFERVGKREVEDLEKLIPVKDSFFAKLRGERVGGKDILELGAPKSLNDFVELEEVVLHFIDCHGGKANPLRILHSLASSEKALSPKLVKLMAKHLEMERAEVEANIERKRRQPDFSKLLHDHDYCDFGKNDT